MEGTPSLDGLILKQLDFGSFGGIPVFQGIPIHEKHRQNPGKLMLDLDL